MYICKTDLDKLIHEMTRTAATAVNLLAEAAEGEASHVDNYMMGYLQGYAHGCDAACAVVENCEKLSS